MKLFVSRTAGAARASLFHAIRPSRFASERILEGRLGQDNILFASSIIFHLTDFDSRLASWFVAPSRK